MSYRTSTLRRLRCLERALEDTLLPELLLLNLDSPQLSALMVYRACSTDATTPGLPTCTMHGRKVMQLGLTRSFTNPASPLHPQIDDGSTIKDFFHFRRRQDLPGSNDCKSLLSTQML
jgi:hypothetical protein